MRPTTTVCCAQGAKGEEVTALQKELNRLGVRDGHGNRLSEDGKFGANTKDALTAYQKQHGLSADGVAGPATLAKLAEGRSHAEAAPKGPQLGDKAHPDTPLHNAIRGHLPGMICNEMSAHVTAPGARAQPRIDSPGKAAGRHRAGWQGLRHGHRSRLPYCGGHDADGTEPAGNQRCNAGQARAFAATRAGRAAASGPGPLTAAC